MKKALIVISALLLIFAIGCDNGGNAPKEEITPPAETVDITNTDPDGVKTLLNGFESAYNSASSTEEIISSSTSGEIYSADGKTLWATVSESDDSTIYKFTNNIDDGTVIKKGYTVAMSNDETSTDGPSFTVNDNPIAEENLEAFYKEFSTYMTGYIKGESQEKATREVTVGESKYTVTFTEVSTTEGDTSKEKTTYEISPAYQDITKIEMISIRTETDTSTSYETYVTITGGKLAGSYLTSKGSYSNSPSEY